MEIRGNGLYKKVCGCGREFRGSRNHKKCSECVTYKPVEVPQERKGWRKYAVNDAFFDNWNRSSAYIAGWILGDGHLTYPGRTPKVRTWRLVIAGAPSEEDHLLRMRREMESNHPVKSYGGALMIQIGSKRLVRALLEKGYSDSSLIDMPKDLMGHQVRGLYDSDGTSQRKRISIASAKRALLESVENQLKERGIKCSISGKEKSYQLWTETSSFEAMTRFMQGDLRLERKYMPA